jgi:RimJ/RimL family protein N-acetyltransferase
MIERLTTSEENVQYVRGIFEHPTIGPFISTDGFDLRDFPYEGMLGDARHYFLRASTKNGEYAGLFYFHEWNSATAWSHALLLSDYRGKIGLALGKEAVKWMFEHGGFRKLVAAVPEMNRHALAYVCAVGYSIEGRLKRSFPKDGGLCDETIVGISKGGD